MTTDFEPYGRTRWYHNLTWYHWLVLAVASMGWMFDTMDQWLYVMARQPALRELLGAGATDADVKSYSGLVQTCFILGWATGGFLFGIIGDRLGRTRTMAITVLMYAGFTGLSGLTRNWQEFAALRFLTGLGIGGEFAAGASLVAEVFPAHARASALGVMQACSAIGNITAGLINLTVGASPDWGWRWMFALGVAPAFLVFIIRMFVKEPDSWHHAKEEERLGGQALGSMRELFGNPVYRRNTLVGVCLAAVGVIGFWGIGTWSPDLLRQAINPDNLKTPEIKQMVEQSVGLAVMAQNAGAFFGILAWAWLAQIIGRRPTFAITFVSCLVMVPTTFFLTKSFTAALVLFPLMGFTTTALFGGFAVYFPELFPTRLRATGTGFCYNVARYLAAGAPFVFGHLSGAIGIQWAATIVALVFPLGLLILPFAPETKGKPLPE